MHNEAWDEEGTEALSNKAWDETLCLMKRRGYA